ncbi:chorismate-binding protein [Flavobacterium sp. TAB 87]|uniref:chorismate-binding protein n=1 Tax=Flavobacterium sp. TAB 87 TaxID=1729581 RepID=UPI00076BE72F|nr:chorismate-binding protein [Flavobacterium sp. TAB 87]KVV14052.1 Menaquinone-specific isochorismate synthase [Flavobacterium sp. TAB 87]
MDDFFEKVAEHKTSQLPFVMYSKPNSDTVFGILQNNTILFEVTDFSEKGFVFASFDKSKMILIPENESKIIKTVFKNNSNFSIANNDSQHDNLAKISFENLVEKGINAIVAKAFKKVVLSRKEEVSLTDFNFIETFQNLIQLYPATFTYCFYHPKVGFWMGATPEQLLKASENTFETTALAGTQQANDTSTEIVWQQKEKDEQQYVTDFIVKRLQNVASQITVTKPYSLKAGAIWHIKTDISGVLNEESTLKEVVDLLHPTPAVCGLPKDKAMQFIVANENYNRTFYTGFLGELNSSLTSVTKSSDLFVNLRCMQIENDSAMLYMGCGITKESIPEKEWEESVNKSMTMKKVLWKAERLAPRSKI